MALKDLVETFLDDVLGVGGQDGAVRDEAGDWWLPGSRMGRVRVIENGAAEAWIEVAHVVATDVENWTPRLWEVANDATLQSPAHTAMVGATLVARMLFNGLDANADTVLRAIDATWHVSNVLCQRVVGELGIGHCPDAEFEAAVDGGAVPLVLDLGIGDGFAAGTGAVDGGLAASSSTVLPSGAAGYL